MLQLKRVLFVFLLISITSCKNTWDGDDKDMFYRSCLDEAKGWAGDKAKPYCDCVIEKVMKKFPNESDALEHIDSVINDPDIKNCKNSFK